MKVVCDWKKQKNRPLARLAEQRSGGGFEPGNKIVGLYEQVVVAVISRGCLSRGCLNFYIKIAEPRAVDDNDVHAQ